MLIVGAGGLAKEVLQVLLWARHTDDIAFLDEITADAPRTLYGRFAVLRSVDEVHSYWSRHGAAFVVAVGAPASREALTARFSSMGGCPETLVSNHALVAHLGVEMGRGVCLMPQALVMVGATIGDGALINKGALVSHDARIGRFCAIAPGARILGHASVADLTEVGAGAVVLPGVKVGTRCRIGAGAVVMHDIPDGTTVAGNPAQPLHAALRRRRHAERRDA